MQSFVFLSALVASPGVALAAAPPAEWACEEAAWGDDVCDCGCAVVDPDCPSGTFEICERNSCPSGTVPWEHEPESCMRSACGDGWRDDVGGEACDDGNALARGGCNADCSEVKDGWECGDMADGCWELEPADPDPKADPPDDVVPDDAKGCTTAPLGAGAWTALVGLLAIRRRAR